MGGKAKTHCIKGHPFSGKTSLGYNICRICRAFNTKTYRANNKEKAQDARKKWLAKSQTHIKDYLDKNRTRINRWQVAYYQKIQKKRLLEKYKTDPLFRLAKVLRHRVYNALCYKRVKKSVRSIDLIGCTISELKTHLETQFKPGMNWKNHTSKGWHVDHIKPCSSFNLADPEEQKKCFHYTNLQPLWWYENQEKHAKINWDRNPS
jgi:Prasinovirus endonuclease VII